MRTHINCSKYDSVTPEDFPYKKTLVFDGTEIEVFSYKEIKIINRNDKFLMISFDGIKNLQLQMATARSSFSRFHITDFTCIHAESKKYVYEYQPPNGYADHTRTTVVLTDIQENRTEPWPISNQHQTFTSQLGSPQQRKKNY